MITIDSNEAVGARLREARTAAGYATAADAARAVGLKPVTVRAHENGQNGLSRDMLSLYSARYGVSPQFLLWGGREIGDPERRPAKVEPPSAYSEMAAELAQARSDLAKAQGQIAYLKDGLRTLLEGLG